MSMMVKPQKFRRGVNIGLITLMEMAALPSCHCPEKWMCSTFARVFEMLSRLMHMFMVGSGSMSGM